MSACEQLGFDGMGEATVDECGLFEFGVHGGVVIEALFACHIAGEHLLKIKGDASVVRSARVLPGQIGCSIQAEWATPPSRPKHMPRCLNLLSQCAA